MPSVLQRVHHFIRKREFLRPGDRVAVAVSGGADSVALLRLLLELREQLGLVLSVAHFHHGIRGEEADLDRDFVSALAREHELELYSGAGDAVAWGASKSLSVETAARELRYRFFSQLLESYEVDNLSLSSVECRPPSGDALFTSSRPRRPTLHCPPARDIPISPCKSSLDRIATAHTLDDQAETVLMKLGRGAGTRGLAGIFPEQKLTMGSIVRPLLEIRREELRSYLRALGQEWREDSSNADLSFTRNRVRARLLPALRADLNPAIETVLAHASAIAQADEEYWEEQIARILPLVTLRGAPTRGGRRKRTVNPAISFDIEKLLQQPLSVQRRLLRAGAENLGCNLDFEHVELVRELMLGKSHGKSVQIAEGWRAHRLFRELRIEKSLEKAGLGAAGYEYKISVPGEIRIPGLAITIRARIREANGTGAKAAYNRAHSIEVPDLEEVAVRSWRPGDRFRAARSASEKRVKELLYPLHLAVEDKALWPVMTVAGQIVWVRGISSPRVQLKGTEKELVIEESE